MVQSKIVVVKPIVDHKKLLDEAQLTNLDSLVEFYKQRAFAAKESLPKPKPFKIGLKKGKFIEDSNYKYHKLHYPDKTSPQFS